MQLISLAAQAFVNHGRWIADCPRPDCNNAIPLTPRQTVIFCGLPGGCELLSEVEWPHNADDIWEALLVRPVPGTRNWAPAQHRQALACGFPNGQTVAELNAETAEHLGEVN